MSLYEYLRSVMSEDEKIEAELSKKARKKTNIFEKKKIDAEVKFNMNNTVIVPSILYASENCLKTKEVRNQS